MIDPEWQAVVADIRAAHARADAAEKPLVTRLGDAIGYGRLMQLAEVCWREKLARDGAPVGSEHTTGPCAALMVPCIHPVRDDAGHCDICCGSGRVTRWVAENIARMIKP